MAKYKSSLTTVEIICLLHNWLSHALPWSIVNPSRADSFRRLLSNNYIFLKICRFAFLIIFIHAYFLYIYIGLTYPYQVVGWGELEWGWGGGPKGYFSSCQKGGPIMSKTIASDDPLALAQWFVIGPRCVRLSHGLIRLGTRLTQTPAVYPGTFDVFLRLLLVYLKKNCFSSIFPLIITVTYSQSNLISLSYDPCSCKEV